MDPTQKLPPKPFINNTQKILQCISAEVQPFRSWIKEKGPVYIRKGRPKGASSILKMKSECNWAWTELNREGDWHLSHQTPLTNHQTSTHTKQWKRLQMILPTTLAWVYGSSTREIVSPTQIAWSFKEWRGIATTRVQVFADPSFAIW